MTARCACGCGRTAVHDHHVLTRQLLRREGGDPGERRNLVPLAYGCHAAHHSRQRPLPLRVLPDGAFEYAAELLGAGRAYERLRRDYSGGDARLDALLEESEAA
jgi:hypothetical protein